METNPAAKWLRDPIRTPLRSGPSAKLSQALSGIRDGLICIFAERVLKKYVASQKSVIHLHLHEVMQYAVTQVFSQVRPARDKPYGGDVKTAVNEMTTLAFKVLNITGSAVQSGDNTTYVQKRIDNDDYTYNDCLDHLEIMTHHVKSMMRKGDKTTLFPLKRGKVSVSYTRFHTLDF